MRGTFSGDFKKYLFSGFVEVEFCHEGGVTFNCNMNIQQKTC